MTDFHDPESVTHRETCILCGLAKVWGDEQERLMKARGGKLPALDQFRALAAITASLITIVSNPAAAERYFQVLLAEGIAANLEDDDLGSSAIN